MKKALYLLLSIFCFFSGLLGANKGVRRAHEREISFNERVNPSFAQGLKSYRGAQDYLRNLWVQREPIETAEPKESRPLPHEPVHSQQILSWNSIAGGMVLLGGFGYCWAKSHNYSARKTVMATLAAPAVFVVAVSYAQDKKDKEARLRAVTSTQQSDNEDSDDEIGD